MFQLQVANLVRSAIRQEIDSLGFSVSKGMLECPHRVGGAIAGQRPDPVPAMLESLLWNCHKWLLPQIDMTIEGDHIDHLLMTKLLLENNTVIVIINTLKGSKPENA